MKKLLIGFSLIASMSSFASEENVNRALKCNVSEFNTSESNISLVELDIVEDTMTIRYSYSGSVNIFEDTFSTKAAYLPRQLYYFPHIFANTCCTILL